MDRSVAMATAAVVPETRGDVAPASGRNSELLPCQGSLRHCGSRERQYKSVVASRPWVRGSSIPAAEGPAHGGPQDPICRLPESRVKPCLLQIPAQSHSNDPTGLIGNCGVFSVTDSTGFGCIPAPLGDMVTPYIGIMPLTPAEWDDVHPTPIQRKWNALSAECQETQIRKRKNM